MKIIIPSVCSCKEDKIIDLISIGENLSAIIKSVEVHKKNIFRHYSRYKEFKMIRM